jgi:hypothetical protein
VVHTSFTSGVEAPGAVAAGLVCVTAALDAAILAVAGLAGVGEAQVIAVAGETGLAIPAWPFALAVYAF